MAVGHAHASSGFDHGAVYSFNSSVGVANERQQSVESKREDGEAVGAGADPGSGEKESEQGEAGNGLNDVRASEDWFIQCGPAGNGDAQRDSDEDGEGGGNSYQPQMFEREFEDFSVILQDELPEAHGSSLGCLRFSG